MKTTIEKIKEWVLAIVILAILLFSGISAHNAVQTPLRHKLYEETWKNHDTIVIWTVYVSRIDEGKAYVKEYIKAKPIIIKLDKQ